MQELASDIIAWLPIALFVVAIVFLAISWRCIRHNPGALGSFLGSLVGLFGIALSGYIGFLVLAASESDRRDHEEKAVAAAIIGELGAICEQMKEIQDAPLANDGNAEDLEEQARAANFAKRLVTQIETVVFESHVAKLGLLPDEAARSVVKTYALVRFVTRKKRDLDDFDPNKELNAAEVEKRLKQIVQARDIIVERAKDAEKHIAEQVGLAADVCSDFRTVSNTSASVPSNE